MIVYSFHFSHAITAKSASNSTQFIHLEIHSYEMSKKIFLRHLQFRSQKINAVHKITVLTNTVPYQKYSSLVSTGNDSSIHYIMLQKYPRGRSTAQRSSEQ